MRFFFVSVSEKYRDFSPSHRQTIGTCFFPACLSELSTDEESRPFSLLFSSSFSEDHESFKTGRVDEGNGAFSVS